MALMNVLMSSAAFLARMALGVSRGRDVLLGAGIVHRCAAVDGVSRYIYDVT